MGQNLRAIIGKPSAIEALAARFEDVRRVAEHMVSPSLTVYEDGRTLVCSDDGDMFGGRCIEAGTQDGRPTDVESVG